MTQITENVDFGSEPLRIDREKCIVYGVKLLGFTSKNGRKYSKAAMESAVQLYEGARVNLNHPKERPDAPRGYQDRLGRVRNASVASDGLRGNLHYNPKHAITEQFLWDCENSPDSMGLSHNVDVDFRRDDDGGLLIESITKVRSVDLVADPATTKSLFESEGDTMSIALSAIAAKLPEERGKSLLEFIEANGDITLQAEDTDKATQLFESLFASQTTEPKPEEGKGKQPEDGSETALESVLQRIERMERRSQAAMLLTEAEIPTTSYLLEELSKLDEQQMRNRIADLPPSARHRSTPVVEFDKGSTPGAPPADMKDFVKRCKVAS